MVHQKGLIWLDFLQGYRKSPVTKFSIVFQYLTQTVTIWLSATKLSPEHNTIEWDHPDESTMTEECLLSSRPHVAKRSPQKV